MNASPFDLKKTFDAYNSWQLAKPGAQNEATPAESLTLLPGFNAELIRSSQPGEDSWVSMAFDPKGRITLGKEKQGLLRFDPKTKKVEVIDGNLLECRGLLYAHGALYANANNSHGLYRLRDTDGDDHFDESTELLHTEGGVGHGRNHLKLGPDGDIYIAHGNNVLLPTNVSDKSPLKHYRNDQLLPNPWDNSMFDGNVELPAGHILRMKPDGSEVQLLAGGLRNPLDIAFNHEGDLFTFDADMERDVGAPWYMPTRVLHVVPGADFGWRRGTGRYPSYYIDTLPSVIDIGLSSPTAVFFGYGAKFPAKYQDALFIFDWSYGRIIAVHLKPRGSSYGGEQETFVSGRPLNVTDGCIGPDGAMWFVTGGRGTQSGLYRVNSIKSADLASVGPISPGAENDERIQRRRLEASVSGQLERDTQEIRHRKLSTALNSPDRFLQHAGRTALQAEGEASRLEFFQRFGFKRPSDPQGGSWLDYGVPSEAIELAAIDAGVFKFTEQKMWRLGRVGILDEAVVEDKLPGLTLAHPLAEARDYNLALLELRPMVIYLARGGEISGNQLTHRKATLEELWESIILPNYIEFDGIGSAERNHRWKEQRRSAQYFRWELTKLLIYLKSPTIITKATDYLKTATTSEDLIFYPMNLRYLKDGWMLDQRRIVFEALNRAEKMNGASSYFKAIADTRAELAAALSTGDAKALADVIAVAPAPLNVQAMPAHSYKQWTMADLEKSLPQVSQGRSYESAKKSLVGAQCVFCHRVSAGNELPAGIVGPDLTQVSARFGRKDLVMHILQPSAAIDEKFKVTIVTRVDGSMASGSLEREDDERVVLKPNPLAPQLIEIAKAQIKSRALSDVSPMPPGLLNVLKPDQILDLLAWFESGGDPKAKQWAK